MGILDFKQAVLDELWAAFVNRSLDSDRWVIEDIRQRVERLPVSEQEELVTGTATAKSYKVPAMQGWICPVCGRGVSPYTAVCPCKNGKGWQGTS